MKILKSVGLMLVVLLILGIAQYFILTPLSLYSFGTYIYLVIIGISFAGILFLDYTDTGSDFCEKASQVLITISLVVFLGFPILMAILGSPMFNASEYKEIVTIEEGNFSEDIPAALEAEIMDVKTAANIGSRVMGEIDNVSQYVISDEYNMIIYQGKTYRVSPLLYASTIKAWGNKGISGYVLVDCQTQEAKLVKLEEKIYYSPSAIFGNDLKRHIRTKYPSALIGKFQFEIDEDGKPYYIVPTYKNTIGMFSGKVLDRVLIVNATTGEISEYTIDKLPEWVDHADSVSHMMENAKYVYTYPNGFWNSIFSQKDVKALSYDYSDSSYYGYSSIRTNNGIEYFTGVTSVNNDESNVGFLAINPRTGKTTFYSCVGAEESSAQSSAEALVQNFGYTASYPFIVNVDGIETYLIALKDKTGTNKAYSFVNVKNYTIATQAATKEEALRLYKNALVNKGANTDNNTQNNEIKAKITELYTAVENSTTYFYFKLEGYEQLFVSSVLNNRNQVLLDVGDTVTIHADLIDNYYLVSNISF
ncbi:MAG: hypothetical protein J6A15_04240 [Clostridia bacterium]|nr:hypothetical protein [Clostridia bacterium]